MIFKIIYNLNFKGNKNIKQYLFLKLGKKNKIKSITYKIN